jgi:outer membrane protein OmpA-like peptidoglycan-associated protein
MKPYARLIFAAALLTQTSLQAEPPVVVEERVTETVTPAQRPVVTEEVVTETVTPVVPGGVAVPVPGVVYDPAVVTRQLSIAPHVVTVPETTATPPPGTKVQTTETTTAIDVPGRPRVYNTERNVVIVEGRELPYVTVPVLFVKETAELLDSESRQALTDTAQAIMTVLKTNPTAVFDIEGHTSTDGADDMNMELSAARARRVYEELTKVYHVPATALSAHGYGETYPNYPNGSESQMVLDRRVLVVRSK